MGGIGNALAGWLGLNDPALTQEQPNPAYSPRVAQTANAISQGLGALNRAIPPEAHMLGAMVPAGNLADMGIWGAGKIASGIADYPSWRASMIEDTDPSIEPYLHEMYQDSQKIYNTHLEKTANQLPNTQRLLEMYHQGIEGQDWYAHTRDELEQHFGPDTDRFIDFLAATSPNNTVAGNVTQALKAYQQYKNGQPFTGFLPAHVDMLNQAVQDAPFGGLKVSSFTQNLKGDPIAVTVDRWIARAMGMGDSVTPQQYKFVDYFLTQAAKAKGIEPRQLQAAIWKTMKDSEGVAGQTGASFEDVLNAKIAKDPALAQAIQKARGMAATTSGYAQGGLQRMRAQTLARLGAPRMQSGGFWGDVASLFDPSAMDPWAEADKAQLRSMATGLTGVGRILGGGAQPQPLVSPQSTLGKIANALNPQNPSYGMTGALTGMIGSQFGGGEAAGLGEKFEGTRGVEAEQALSEEQKAAARKAQEAGTLQQLPLKLGDPAAAAAAQEQAAGMNPMPGLPGQPVTPPAATLPSKIPKDFTAQGAFSQQAPVTPFDPSKLATGVGGGGATLPPVGQAPAGSLWDAFTGGAPMQENYNPASVSPSGRVAGSVNLNDPRWAQMQQNINSGIGNLQKQLETPGFEPRTAPLRGRRPGLNIQGDEPIVGWNLPGDPLADFGFAEGGLYGRMRSNMLDSLRR